MKKRRILTATLVLVIAISMLLSMTGCIAAMLTKKQVDKANVKSTIVEAENGALSAENIIAEALTRNTDITSEYLAKELNEVFYNPKNLRAIIVKNEVDDIDVIVITKLAHRDISDIENGMSVTNYEGYLALVKTSKICVQDMFVSIRANYDENMLSWNAI